MKRAFAIPILALFVGTFAQKLFEVQDSTKGFTLRAKEFRFETLSGPGLMKRAAGNSVYQFDLTTPGGQVYAASRKQGIEFYAPHVVVNAVSTTILKQEANSIQSATATGGVRAISTGKEGRSEITGSTAKYSAKGSADGTLAVSGPVKLTNFDGNKQTFVATGSTLNADLRAGSANPLRTATLTGSVHITIHKAPQPGQQATDAKITAQRMVYDQDGRTGTIKLTGGVRSTGLFGGSQVLAGANEVDLSLNEKGEIYKISGSG